MNEQQTSKQKHLLIERLCSQELSADDKELLELLMEQDKDFAQHVAAVKKAQQIYSDIELIESIDVDKAYTTLERDLRSKRRTRFFIKVQRYAALIALPLLITTFILLYLQFVYTGDSNDRLIEVYVPHGAILSYQLPDQSTVYLNSGSTLRYPRVFDSEKREVYLDGEAFFTVEADKEHPFFVHTEYGISTYVYGTEFNVNAYKKDQYIETMLLKGQLDIVDDANRTRAKLIPGDAISYDEKDRVITKSRVDVEEKLAWKSGKLIFRDTPIAELIRRLERRFNVKINLYGEVPNSLKIRATFDVEPLEQILDYLALSVDLTWKYSEIDHHKPRSIKNIDIILN